VIDVFTIILGGVAFASGLLCVSLGLAGKKPADLTVLATALVGVLLIVQVVISIVAPFVGNHPSGNALEYWMYLITGCLMPPAAIAWALSERSKWSTVVLGVAGLAIAVMTVRMYQIWTVQVA
jgi:hypothetical protein